MRQEWKRMTHFLSPIPSEPPFLPFHSLFYLLSSLYLSFWFFYTKKKKTKTKIQSHENVMIFQLLLPWLCKDHGSPLRHDGCLSSGTRYLFLCCMCVSAYERERENNKKIMRTFICCCVNKFWQKGHIHTDTREKKRHKRKEMNGSAQFQFYTYTCHTLTQ